MAIPLAALIALQMGSQAVSAVGNGISQNRQRKSQEQLSREQLALEREQGLMDTASRENELNPFRQQLSQASSIASLDQMQNASYAPVSMQAPSRYASYVPKVSGGFSWQPSQDVRDSAGALKQNVMAGRTAPSMTTPDNYGKTATLDMNAVAGGANPATGAAFSNGPLIAPATGISDKLKKLTALTDRAGQFGRGGLAAAATKIRTREIAEFEQTNPGWTIDAVGRVTRKARV